MPAKHFQLCVALALWTAAIGWIAEGRDAVAAPKAQAGLVAEYFGSSKLENPNLTTLVAVPIVDSKEMGGDWAARFSGFITAPAEGEYSFRAEADTGIRLTIAGKKVIDGWTIDGPRTGSVKLTKDHPTPLVIEYLFNRDERGERPGMKWFWTAPEKDEEPLPTGVLSNHAPLAPISIEGTEQQRVNLLEPDGALKPLPGVRSVQVFRSCRERPELADGDGWTYAHHMDIAVWKGKLYAAWAMTERDEDVEPYKVFYSTSADGVSWSKPAELFPRGLAFSNRFYFYRAKNGRMLAFCGAASDKENGALKKTLLVREINANHGLGDVFTLIGTPTSDAPEYTAARNAGFATACQDAIGNKLLLEQQDFGNYLGERRMPSHDNPSSIGWWKSGKAYCFYERADKAIVGISKLGFTTISKDNGKTWTKPEVPPSLVAGGGKIWGQRVAANRYFLAYNPDRDQRFPLVVVQGDDGQAFRDMRVVHGELPRLRYEGKAKDGGPQYVRGLASWSNDGTLADNEGIWLIYSMNKEDIWVARLPLSLLPDAREFANCDFESTEPLAGWNVYQPTWAPVEVIAEPTGKNHCLTLRDRDPADYARAIRTFPDSSQLQVKLRVKPDQLDRRAEIELVDGEGNRPVRIAFTEAGQVQATNSGSPVELGSYQKKWHELSITADVDTESFTVRLDDQPAKSFRMAENKFKPLCLLSLRSGVWRGRGEPAADSDAPLPTEAVFHFDDVLIEQPKP